MTPAARDMIVKLALRGLPPRPLHQHPVPLATRPQETTTHD